jgi:YegS/Rv2252/BmrU family lipid kinase
MPEQQSDKHTLIIINPKAGKRIFIQLFLPQILQIFSKNGVVPIIHYTRFQGHASRLVRRYRQVIDFVTVFGGDGTIDEVLQGMSDAPLPIGIIPFGTVNVLALELGIPFHPILAAQVIVDGFVRRIDMGRLNGKPFILMVSTGIDAYAVHNVDLKLKKVLGKVAYGLTALWSAATYKTRSVMVSLPHEGIRDKGYMVVIANSRYYGGRISLDRETAIDDGKLNVILFKGASTLELFRTFVELVSGRRKKMPDVAFYQTSNEVVVTSRKQLYMQTDGDKVPYDAAHITISKQILPVFVPKKR